MKKYLLQLIVVLSLFSACTFAQVYNIDTYNGQTVAACKGDFFDSDNCFGPEYCSNENYTITFDAGSATSRVSLNFLFVNIEWNYDFLRFYDGPSTASPLITTLTGYGQTGDNTCQSAAVVTSTGRYLTVRFTSDGTINYEDFAYYGGWQALIGCLPANCGANIPASDYCSTATQICDLNGYCGNTSGWYTAGAEACNIGSNYFGSFCGSIENNSWVSFVANSSTATLSLTSSNCTYATSGIQAAVFSTPNCSAFSLVSNCVSQTAGPGTFTLTASGLTVGTTYYVMIDGYGGNQCDYTITAQGGIQTVNITNSAGSSCPGSSTTFSVSAVGTGPFTYTWNPAPNSGQGTNTASYTVPSSTTVYTVTVGGACGASETATYTLTPTSITPSASNGGAVCAGSTISLFANGGTSYSWSGPGGFTSTAQNPTRPSSTTAMSGVYTVTVTANGCTATATTNVTVNPTPTVSVSGTNTICAGQSTTLSASGATSYSWNTGSTSSSISVSPASSTTYTVTGTSGTCTNSATYAVTVTPNPTVSVSGTNSICAGQSTTLSASGATSYSWNTGSTSSSISVSPASNTTYTVTGTTGTCTNSATYAVTVSPNPTVSVSGTNTICSGQSTTLSASGATSYSWNTGSTSSSISVSPTSNTTYTVTGTSGTCTNSATYAVTVNPTPTVSVSGGNSVCPGESTTLTASGASSYVWNTGSTSASITVSPVATTTYTVTGTASTCTNTATFTVSVTPNPTVTVSGSNAICTGQSTTLSASGASSYTWSNGVTAPSITVSPTSNTTYTVTGGTGTCTTTATYAVAVSPNPTVTVTGISTICNGQSTTLTASGATSYAWNTGDVTSSATVSPTSTSTYTVTGTSNSCTATATYTVVVNPTPTVTVNGNSAICAGNSTTLTAGGANSYSWNTGATSTSINVSPTSTTTYTVTGSDANGCTNSAQTTVTVNQLPVVTVPATQTLTCSNPSVSLNGSATPAGSTLTWSNSSGFSSGNPATASATGYYVLTAVSPDGCIAEDSVEVVPSSNLPNASATQSGNEITCTTTSVSLTGSSTTAGATLSWSDAAGPIAGNPITITAAGSYTLTVTDPSNGCSSLQIVTIADNTTPPVVNAGADDELTCSTTSLSFTGTTSGTNPSFTWSGPGIVSGTNTSTVTVNAAGTYILSVTDSLTGCTNTDQVVVTTNTVTPNANAGSDDTLLCATPTVLLDGNSTNNGVTYSWAVGGSSISTTDTVTVGNGGTYVLTVTDTANGCVGTDTAVVYVDPNVPVISNVSNQTIDCNTTQATLNASAGAGVTLEWNGPGIPANSPNGTSVTSAGTFTVTATSGTGCTANQTLTVALDTVAPMVDAGVADTITCSTTQAALNGSPATGVTYAWNGPSVVLPAAQNSLAAAPGTYTLTVTSTTNGCVATDVVVIAIDTVTPGATATASGQITCTNSQANISGSSTATNVTYQWNGTSFSSTQQNDVVTAAGTYTLTVTNNGNGCTSQATVTILTDTVLPNANAGIDDILPCGGGSISLNASSTTPSASYAWAGPGGFSDNTANPSITMPGQYTLTVTNPANGCTTTDIVDIGTSNVVATFSADPTTGFAPLTVNFTDSSLNATSYNWSFGDGNTSTVTNPSNIYTTNGTYTVILTASNGSCSDTATVIIIVEENSTIVIPNVFTPNNDGINDDFIILSTGIKELHADIFNRWGEKVFELKGPNSAWDGKTNAGDDASNGTYFIMLKATGFDGKEYTQEAHIGLFRN